MQCDVDKWKKSIFFTILVSFKRRINIVHEQTKTKTQQVVNVYKSGKEMFEHDS